MKAMSSTARLYLLIGLIIFANLLWAVLSPARAATVQCAGIADMLAQLDTKYGERQLFVGQAEDGATVMILANPGGTTWTAVIVGDAGKACIGALGASWSPGDPPRPQGTEG
jgi:hypothetical protein